MCPKKLNDAQVPAFSDQRNYVRIVCVTDNIELSCLDIGMVDINWRVVLESNGPCRETSFYSNVSIHDTLNTLL